MYQLGSLPPTRPSGSKPVSQTLPPGRTPTVGGHESDGGDVAVTAMGKMGDSNVREFQ